MYIPIKSEIWVESDDPIQVLQSYFLLAYPLSRLSFRILIIIKNKEQPFKSCNSHMYIDKNLTHSKV